MRLRNILLLILILAAASVGGVYLLGLYHFRAAQSAWERQALDQAEAQLELCLKVWPTSYQARLLAARVARRHHDVDVAAQRLLDCDRIGGRTDAVALESILLQVQQGNFAGMEESLHDRVEASSADAPFILE